MLSSEINFYSVLILPILTEIIRVCWKSIMGEGGVIPQESFIRRHGSRIENWELRIENYLSLKRRGLTNRNIFIYYPLKMGAFKPQYFGNLEEAVGRIIPLFFCYSQPKILTFYSSIKRKPCTFSSSKNTKSFICKYLFCLY